MRPIPLLTALLVAAALFYWFELRHPSADEAGAPAAAAAPAGGAAAAERASAPGPAATGEGEPVPVVVTASEAQETNARLVLRGRTQARLDAVRWDIERLEITAPFAGVLESDTAELGALLIPGAVCATVVDLGEIRVEAYVSEQEVDQLRVGQSAEARLINGTTATGEITFVSRVADDETRTFEVEVTLPNPDGVLRAGMTAELTIPLPALPAHLVPQSALTLDDDGRLGVRLAENGVARFHPVTILRDTAEGVWVAGLPERADIIVVGQEFVRDGRHVVAGAAAADQIR